MSCEHYDYTPKYTHVICNDCFWIKTDHDRSDWGIATNKWFPDIESARFYQREGRYPDEMLTGMLPSIYELLAELSKLPTGEAEEFVSKSIKLLKEQV